MPQKYYKCKIPFHQPYFDEEDIKAVVETLRSGWVTTGPAVKAFEKAFCEYVGALYSVAVNSCTAAMHLALAALGIGPGDAVLTTPYTFVATAEAIQYLGAKPVFVDISEEDFNLDPGLIEDVIRKSGEKVRALLPVHVAGHPCDMKAIMEVAEWYGLRVVEDAAHALEAAIGAERKAQRAGGVETERRAWREVRAEEIRNPLRWKVGTIGDATCFSFYATKNITTGEGGTVTTNDAELAEKIRCLSLHGMSRDAWKRYSAEGSWYYEIIEQGYKYNMPDLLAALGLSQLRKVDKMFRIRRRYAEIYEQELGVLSGIITPKPGLDVRHAWHLYIIRLQTERLKITRTEFIQKLEAAGIGTSVHFIPLHLHPFYQKNFNYKYGDFPVAEKVYESAVSLPLYPKMTEEHVCYVASKVEELLKENYKPTLFAGHEMLSDNSGI